MRKVTFASASRPLDVNLIIPLYSPGFYPFVTGYTSKVVATPLKVPESELIKIQSGLDIISQAVSKDGTMDKVKVPLPFSVRFKDFGESKITDSTSTFSLLSELHPKIIT